MDRCESRCKVEQYKKIVSCKIESIIFLLMPFNEFFKILFALNNTSLWYNLAVNSAASSKAN